MSNNKSEEERIRLCKEFMQAIVSWIKSGKPLDDEFKAMVKDYEERIKELEDNE